jgi:hypothetical protein
LFLLLHLIVYDFRAQLLSSFTGCFLIDYFVARVLNTGSLPPAIAALWAASRAAAVKPAESESLSISMKLFGDCPLLLLPPPLLV